MADFSTIKIGNSSFDVKDDIARNDITSLATRLTTLENNNPDTEAIQTRLEELKYLSDVALERLDNRTKTYFDTEDSGFSSSDYSYRYVTFQSSSYRYLLLWGVTHTTNRKTITLPFPMKNTDYTVVLSDVYTAKTAYAYAMSHSHTTTSFTTVTGDNSTFRFIVIGRLT